MTFPVKHTERTVKDLVRMEAVWAVISSVQISATSFSGNGNLIPRTALETIAPACIRESRYNRSRLPLAHGRTSG